MNRVWVISDTHFGHKNILKYQPEERKFDSIEEHDRTLIELWNSQVKSNDTIWHLGDVALCAKEKIAEILTQLNGYKRLVLGNHDSASVVGPYFDRIYGVAEYGRVLLSHVPIHPCQLERYKVNVHGHLHSKSVGDPRYRCVSVEHTNLMPVLLQTVIQQGL